MFLLFKFLALNPLKAVESGSGIATTKYKKLIERVYCSEREKREEYAVMSFDGAGYTDEDCCLTFYSSRVWWRRLCDSCVFTS